MKPRLSYLAFVFVAIALMVIIFSVSRAIEQGQDSASTYWGPVERAIGKEGSMLPGGVFKISLARNQPDIMIGGVRLKPAMALDSWVSFMRMGNGTTMMGDLVVTADEMGPVQDKLVKAGVDITAIHNTLIGESPQVYDLHIGGQGDPADMAMKIRVVLEAAGISYGGSERAGDGEYRVNRERLDSILGYNGQAGEGIYSYEVPRAEVITVEGMEMPPSMDMASVIKFQPLGGGRAAVTGDLFVRPDEVTPVIRALNENGITATALHTHMLQEEPRMFMLHFWATGEEDKLAQGLRTAIDQTNSKKLPGPIARSVYTATGSVIFLYPSGSR